MTQVWHDAERDLLVYPNGPGAPLQVLPDATLINGNYFAVPRTLRNSQILRLYDYPVLPVIDERYDWPRLPGITPYAKQKAMANFMALHPRCFNLSDLGCVDGQTPLETRAGAIPISRLAEVGQAIELKSCTDSGVQFVRADSPFLKGLDKLYRVEFASGRSIVVTAKHVFLTSRGWISCADLVVGEQLPKFDADLRASNLEFSLSAFLRDAQRSTNTEQDFRDRSDIPACGGQLLSAKDIDQVSIPSPADFQEHNRAWSQTDVLGTKYIRRNQILRALLSKLNYVFQNDRLCMEFLNAEYVPTQADGPNCICGQFPQCSSLFQPIAADQEFLPILALGQREDCIDEYDNKSLASLNSTLLRFAPLATPLQAAFECSQSLTSKPPCDTVTKIAYVKTDVYYDLHVPQHQNYIAHGLCNHNTGKTLAALWAADWLMRQWPKGKFRALICAPLSLLQRVWADAIFQNFLNKRSFAILHGDADRRSDLLEKDVDFYIINHDGVKVGAQPRKKRSRMVLGGFCEALAQRKDIQLAIVDEAAAFRDASSDRHHAARAVLGERPYLWLMTATPTPNAPTDAYGLAKLVNNAWGMSFNSFQLDTMLKVSLYKWVPRKDGYDKARALLQPAIRVDIAEVWDAPPTTTQQREVPLTSEQLKLLAQLKRDLQVTVRSGQAITAMNEGAARQKFIQIVGGVIYDHDHKEHMIDAEPRLREIEAVVEQTTRKIVLMTPLTGVLNSIYKRLSKKYGCAILNGQVTPRQRAEVIRKFEVDDALRIIIADPQTTAHGINEFALVADTIIWTLPVDKNELYIQGNGRVNRPGQKYPTTIVQLVSTKLEREIFARLATNTSLQGALLDAIQRGEL